MSKVILCCS